MQNLLNTPNRSHYHTSQNTQSGRCFFLSLTTYQQFSFLIDPRSDCLERAITISSVSRVIIVGFQNQTQYITNESDVSFYLDYFCLIRTFFKFCHLILSLISNDRRLLLAFSDCKEHFRFFLRGRTKF